MWVEGILGDKDFGDFGSDDVTGFADDDRCTGGRRT